MENTTLLIDEKEKENAKALTQSFARKDIKSRAYVNVLGAEACMRYLKDEGISVGEIYNMHNIRKILEEFDISDLMLSNISIDVRVVFNENEIFIPKSHFEFNITPDIYVVLKINKDYSETEFLGFFEPKMINKNNSNADYYFIEKEKLSSPETFKTYVENFNGSTNSDISESDMENAEILMVAMADHNISEADMKTLLNYLKTNASLRDKFSEFESFEMIAYQTANTEEMIKLINNESLPASDTAVAESEEENAEVMTEDMMAVSETEGISDVLAEDMPAASEAEDVSAQMDEFMENSEGELGSLESALDEFSSVDSLSEENKEADFEDFSEMVKEEEKSDGNAIGDMLAGGAVLGAEIAGAAVASAAISGAVEGAEIVKDAAQAADAALDAASNIADSVTDKAPEIESKASDGLIDNIDVSAEIGSTEEIPVNNDVVGIENLESVETEKDTTDNENAEEALSADMFSEMQDLVTEDSNSSDVSANDILEASLDDLEFGDGIDSIEFSSGDDEYGDLVFEDNDDTSSFKGHSDHSFGSGSPGISTVVNTPISQATDLVSMESIQESMLAKKMEHIEPGSLMETMEMDEFQNLVDNYVHKEIEDMSETTEFSDIEKAVDKNSVDPKLPNNVDASIYKDIDESGTDDFVEDMPEAVTSTEEHPSEPTSDDFVEDMPEESKSTGTIAENSLDNVSDSVAKETSDDLGEININAENLASDMFNQNGISSLDDISNIDLNENPISDMTVDAINVPQSLDDIPALDSDMFDQTDIEAAAMGNVKSYEGDEASETISADLVGEKPTAENTPEFDMEDIEAAAKGNVKSYESDEVSETISADLVGEKPTAENTPEFDMEDIEAAAKGNVKSYESDEASETVSADVVGEKPTAENTPEFDMGDIEAAAKGNVKSYESDEASETVSADVVGEKPTAENTPEFDMEDIEAAAKGNVKSYEGTETSDAAAADTVEDGGIASEVNITEGALAEDKLESDIEFAEISETELVDNSILDELELELGEETLEEPAEKVEDVIPESVDISETAASNVAEESVEISEAAAEPVIAEETAGIAAETAVADIKDVSEEEVKANNFSELSGLDSIEDFSEGMDGIPEVVEEENLSSTASTDDNGSLGVLYTSENSPEQMVSPIPEDLAEDANYDFKPKKNYALIPIAAALIVTLIAGSVVGVMMKSKSSVDSETLIQTSPENGSLANPETDNSGVLSDEESDDIEPAIPEEEENIQEQAEAGVVAPTDNDNKISQAAKQEAIKNTKEAVKKTNEAIKEQASQVNAPKKPLNANKSITLRKVSWEVPDYLSYSDNIKTYLQTAGKSIKLTLSSDLLLTNDYIYSNTVKINLKLDKSGSIQSSQITQSSGSTQVDKIVLQTVKDTLNVVKPAAGEVPTPTYNLGLIIYL